MSSSSFSTHGAVVYRTLGVLGLVEMGVFLGILMVGFIYAWDNGALEWK